MDFGSKFAGRYKIDMSIDNLRAKVARRKSVTQKENRHKEFRKSRGLALADANVSTVREQDLTVIDESSIVKANLARSSDAILQAERRARLLRYKEEKELRKLKEQRAKASKGIFKCGIYKPEMPFVSEVASQTATKGKPKEKPPAPSVTRVTRSTVRTELPANRTRTQAIPVNVLNSKAPLDRAAPKARGQTSIVKKSDRENKVSAIPSTRTTRSAAHANSKLPVAAKAPLKKTAATKPQKTTRQVSPEMVSDKTEPPVIEDSNDDIAEPEPILAEPCIETGTVPVDHERKPSFAPQNFVFQPMDGLSTFKFQPMTPNRANAFLTPAFTFSPLDGARNFVVTRDPNTTGDQTNLVSPTEPSPTATELNLELDVNASPREEVLECSSDASSAPQASPVVTPPPCEPSGEDIQATQPEQPSHDVPYFRDTMKSEIQKLTLLCSDWDRRIDMEIPEDAKDLIRTTVGQTRLLLTERFKQFEGLVDNCEFKRGEKETTCTDLLGFWDMIYFQIEDVNKKFVNLGKLEENSWQQNPVQTKKVVRKKIAPAATGKPNQGDLGRAAARSRLAAIKAAMKNRVKVEEPFAAGEAPVIPMQVDPVVFDAGFFRIESPAKLPGSLRKNQSSSQTNTPKSNKKNVRNSGTPTDNGVEEATGDVKPEKSPSPARKVLFGMPEEEESLQNQEPDPVVQHPEPTETDGVPAAVDFKYLVPTQALSLGAEESPGLIRCLGLEESETTQDGCDTETDIETSATVDDVFMCSPEKAVPTTEASSEPGPDEDLKTDCDPLDFLGSCTPIMVQHLPMRVEPGAALTDLIMFSPMEK